VAVFVEACGNEEGKVKNYDLWAFKGDRPRLIAFLSRELRIVLVAALLTLGYFLR